MPRFMNGRWKNSNVWVPALHIKSKVIESFCAVSEALTQPTKLLVSVLVRYVGVHTPTVAASEELLPPSEIIIWRDIAAEPASCHDAAVPLVAVKTLPAAAVPLTVTPFILATVGPGYVPLRSPLAAPEGARLLVVVASVAESAALAVPAAEPAKRLSLPAATVLLVVPMGKNVVETCDEPFSGA